MAAWITDTIWPLIDTGRPALNLLLRALVIVAGIGLPILGEAWQWSPLVGLAFTIICILALAVVVFGAVVLWALYRQLLHPTKDTNERTFRQAFDQTQGDRQSAWDYFSGLFASWKKERGDLSGSLRDLIDSAQIPALQRSMHIGRWVERYYGNCDSAGQHLLDFAGSVYPAFSEKSGDLQADRLREQQAQFWDDWAIRAKRNGGYAFVEVMKAAQANFHLVRLVAMLEVMNDRRLRKIGGGKTGLYGLADRLSKMK